MNVDNIYKLIVNLIFAQSTLSQENYENGNIFDEQRNGFVDLQGYQGILDTIKRELDRTKKNLHYT